MEFQFEEAMTILSRTSSVLRALLEDLPEGFTVNNEGPETWSPFDVLGHLIHGEKTDWIPRARIILEKGESRPFEPFDRTAMFESSRGKTLGDLLDEFASLRSSNLDQLRRWAITPAEMQKTGIHPALGRVTLGELLSTWVVHDLDHLAQIIRTMAKQYSPNVGPWRAYLSVLAQRKR